MENLLTVVDFKSKQPGDLIVRKEDSVVVGTVMENGHLHLSINDRNLNCLWCRPSHNEPLVESLRVWKTDTGLTVKETRESPATRN